MATAKRILSLCLLLGLVLTLVPLSACSTPEMRNEPAPPDEARNELAGYLVAVEDEPPTVDFQCTTIHYTIATNVFNRLVEMVPDSSGEIVTVPSLAEAWEVSEDGLRYTFRLREGVRFSNGSALSSSDVLYTLTRLLTHPDSCNRDIAEIIKGAKRLEERSTDLLEGFEILDELRFVITLEQPFEAFLACLSMPGASILDEETTREAGDRFGKDPDWTIGTGSFILWQWEPGKGMLLRANPDCWEGPPKCDGLDLRFLNEPESIRVLFEDGGLDVLDLDELDNSAEYYIRGDIYQDRLFKVQRIGITYFALNESIRPLHDVSVRRALQLALNRQVLLDAVYSGRGSVENGIFPHGLYGYNPELPELPCDPERAAALLAEAGYPEGFDLRLSVKSSSTQWEMTLATLAAAMWEKIGVRVNIELLEDSEFMRQRKSGELECYSATWTADFNDPDNFIYTFFGTEENSRFRSLCYPREEIMERVRDARTIHDSGARLREYQELERIIVQEDAAWIPLFSRLRFYVTSERASGIRASWNGSVKNNYREISIRETEKGS